MGWKSSFGGLTLLLTLLVGCKGRVFLTEDQFNAHKSLVPPDLQENPNVGTTPTIPMVGAPPTLYNLERQIRYLSLAEAVSICLEQGTVGQPSLLFPGVGLDNLIQAPQGTAPSGSDSIRVLAMDPATTAANIDASLAKFDAVVGTSMTWVSTDQPIASALQNIQSGGTTSGINAIVQQQAQLQSGIYKPLPTGGVAGITFTVPYTFTNLPARVNPSYQPSLQFTFEQPLLQGFGTEINQLRAFHPGSIIPFSPPNSLTQAPAATYLPYNFNNVSGVGLGLPPGILIARIRFNQNRAEFERNVNQMLLNVENAYWNLYGSYWQLYSREQGLRFAYEAWKIVGAKYKVGRVSLADFAQAEGQYNLFRSQRLQAIDTVLDNERQLRAIMGLQIEDGTRLVPSDAPTLAEYRPDWETALQEALQNRPELYMARQDVKVSQLNVQLAKNYLLPDLRSFLTYDDNSIGNRLDGSGGLVSPTSPGNAFRNLASNTFNDWTVGLRLAMPLGYRFAHAQLRQSQLQLARAFFVLQDQELKAERFLGLYFRRMSSGYAQIKAARAQRDAFATQLRVRYEKYRQGAQDATLDLLLEAQRFWADALATEYQAIVTYNNAIAGWEYAKGTILQHDNVTISEGPIPVAAQKRAVEHMRERTKALVLRDRSAATGKLAQPLSSAGPVNLVPQINASSLPSFWKDAPPLKEAEELPPPDKLDQTGNGQPPKLVEDMPLKEVFPDSELPNVKPADAVKPATPVSRPATKAHPKTAKPTNTFGSLRSPDAPMPVLPLVPTSPLPGSAGPLTPATPPAANPPSASTASAPSSQPALPSIPPAGTPTGPTTPAADLGAPPPPVPAALNRTNAAPPAPVSAPPTIPAGPARTSATGTLTIDPPTAPSLPATPPASAPSSNSAGPAWTPATGTLSMDPPSAPSSPAMVPAASGTMTLDSPSTKGQPTLPLPPDPVTGR